ncbi:antichymotrypsin-2-like [Microplitis mediator]|uniref:antichymotrypsin-2-like n=1 Tax=Microplitis mediator TaxID=375433 RepID=UPI002552C321|nr:antichymotrypsin-2-like [Microplitis mediator]
MKVFGFFIILIVSIILSSKTESEACVWKNWLCDWITGRNNNDEPTAPSYTKDEKMQGIRNISSSFNHFHIDVLKDMDKKINGSFIVSPFSAAMILMMSGYGASDDNAKKMNSLLHFDTNNNTYKTGIYSLIEMVNALNPNKLELANKIYAGKNQEIKSDFKSLVNKTFKSSIENVDFGLSESTAKKIDDWRAEKNHHRIRNVIKPDEISKDTELLLINSVYFSALWKEPFNEANTKLTKFTISDEESVEQQIMNRKMEPTASNGDVKIYTLDLKRDSNDDNLQFTIMISGKDIKNPVDLPKITIETTMNLENKLDILGINFSNITKQGSGLKINKVVQKFTLEINELGIEAAIHSEASFANKTGSHGPPLKQVPIFNKYSFDFDISYNETLLFAGHVAKQ